MEYKKYASDGFIYDLKGQNIGKWFDQKYIPSLGKSVSVHYDATKDIAKLEERCFLQEERVYIYQEEVCSPAFKALENKKVAYAINKDGKWIRYSVTKEFFNGEKQSLISNDYCSSPKIKTNLEIGQKYHDSRERIHQLMKRASIFYTVLREELEKLANKQKLEFGKIINLIINGREYSFQAVQDSRLHWELISWRNKKETIIIK